MKQRRAGGIWLYSLFALIVIAAIGFFSARFLTTGNLVIDEQFKSPQKCLFVSDCKKLSEENGTPLTCRLASPASREKSCLPPLLEGKRCTVNDDCDAGLACAKPNPDALYWICKRTPRKPGETCQKREDCGENHTCVLDDDSDPFTTCQPIPRTYNNHCVVDDDCAAGLKCVLNFKTPVGLMGHCLPARQKGEACHSEMDCVEGLYCRDTRAGGRVCMTGEEFKKMWR